MKQFKIAMAVLVLTSCFVTMLLYYWHQRMLNERNMHWIVGESSEEVEDEKKEIHDVIPGLLRVEGTPMMHIPLDEIYKDTAQDESFEPAKEQGPWYLINTPGCRIPVAIIPFNQILKQQKRKKPGKCGVRAVYLNKVEADTIQATIKDKYMKTYLRRGGVYECCYRFFTKSTQPGQKRTKIKYTSCHKLKDFDIFTLQSDFINVKCSEKDKQKNTSHVIYDDVYPFTKIVSPIKQPNKDCKKRFNVLLLGIDSMSLARFSSVMTRTVKFFEENFWLGYRGFHKIGDNTLPNLIAAFTGMNLSAITQKCSGKMDECGDLLIWNKFRQDGYVTAYGEDYIRLPDTFHDEYEFKNPPTDHYMRPFFMKEETEFSNQSLVCAGKAQSGQHILDYALDFAVTYRSKSFFGVFWVNSYSHNANSHPEDGDKTIENFLNRLSYTGILDDTFIILFSDHGIRFGELRLLPESYYDERLPSLFIWVPLLFKSRHTRMFQSLALNQFQLTTHYDLYNTLIDIHRLSVCRKSNVTALVSVAEGCPKCHSWFQTINGSRSCKDAAIDEKWCACHHMFPLTVDDTEAMKSVNLVVKHIKNISSTLKPKRCWGCMSLTLKNIIRIHFYYDKDKVNLYHIVAIAMSPGNVSYEATVTRQGDTEKLVGSVSVISPYRGLGRCTVHPKDRVFCICQKIENCSENS